jgi:hypothetical protein
MHVSIQRLWAKSVTFRRVFSPITPDGVNAGNWIQTDPKKGWFVILRLSSRSNRSSPRSGGRARSNWFAEASVLPANERFQASETRTRSVTRPFLPNSQSFSDNTTDKRRPLRDRGTHTYFGTRIFMPDTRAFCRNRGSDGESWQIDRSTTGKTERFLG